MSERRDRSGSRSASEDAVGWFTRLQDQAATAEDWAGFEAWLTAAPENAAAYERLEAIWVELEAPEAQAALGAAPGVALASRRTVSRRGWLAAGGALAAGLAAAVVGVETFREPAGEAFVTRPGETRRVVLADGTRMHLNAASQVTVRLARRARRVELAEGEATFDVTHDPARPFLIDVGDREVRVVGTEFNLRRRGGHVALTVRRGVVEVRPKHGGAGAPVRVAAGQHFARPEGGGPGVISAASDAAFAWTQGQLVYEGAPLSDVAADLSRSLGEPVRVADPPTGRLRFSGVLSLDDRAALPRRLEAFVPVRVTREGGAMVLRRR